MISSCLTLNGLELHIYLGWPTAERLQLQTVKVDITIQFTTPPSACTTDNLQDTFCYDALVTLLKHTVMDRPFKLLEHLGHELYQTAKHFLPPNIDLRLCVSKKPPIEGLTGGVQFCYGTL